MRRDDERITVLVVDDDDNFRDVVASILADDEGIAVVGQARDGGEAIALAQELVPDVVLLDIGMPASGAANGGRAVRGGIAAAAAISRLAPTTKVVMLTASDEEADVYEALLAGASGYVVKDDLLDDLAGVVRTMADDLGLLLSPSIATKVLTQFRAPPRPDPGPALSDREFEVLDLVGLGKTNDQIADDLFLSSHTVKRHVANILAKLHQRSRADAVLYAARNGQSTDDGGLPTPVPIPK